MEVLPGDASMPEVSGSSALFALNSSLVLAQHLMEIGARATNCYGHLQTAEGFDRSPSTLFSLSETVRRLKAAHEAAILLGHPLQVICCTEARDAVALEDDHDVRDRRFLSGMKTGSNSYVYCGGLDAAISRALVFARHADVVCLRTHDTDLNQAARFASEVRSSFPGKKLGFGYSSAPDGVRWNELDHRAFGARLRQMGYDLYFVTQFGQTTFLHPPVSGSWVLIDDVVRAQTIDDETIGKPQSITDAAVAMRSRHKVTSAAKNF
jgi:isocitrate lyase